MNTRSLRFVRVVQRSPLQMSAGSRVAPTTGPWLARWNPSRFDESYLRRESSTVHGSTGEPKPCCSSPAKTVPIPSLSTMPPTLHNPRDDEKEKKTSCCHSSSSATAPGTAKGRSNAASSSSLPIWSGQFWSDPASWKTASSNTFRCLIGCTAGDMSMLFYLQAYHPALSPGLAMALAMGSGILTSIILETVVLRVSKSSNMSWKAAFKTATGMSLISMLTMEAVENAVDYHLMGWGNVNLADPIFWKAIGWSALAGWSAPLPFNYWNLKRHGKSCH